MAPKATRSSSPLELMKTKLNKPVMRSTIVQRERLTNRLVSGIKSKLCLVVAPAGYGKTTLLSEWQILSSKVGWPVAWVSLDKTDNEPPRFWAYFFHALQSIIPELSLDLIYDEGQFERDFEYKWLLPLINQISDYRQNFSLVLDDFQVIENERIHDNLVRLIYCMPVNMHLVIATRETPPFSIAQLRVRNQVCEVQEADLRFNQAESKIFFRDVMKVAVDTEDIISLLRITEGWIAGLQLVALSMRENRDVKKFIDDFGGTNRHILDYLTDQVLTRLEESTKDFLIQTSILTDMSAPLCNHVLGIKDSQKILDYLERSNIFVFPLDDNRIWYRYHALFGDLLNNQLEQQKPEYIRELHLKACKWLNQNGYLEKAIPHAISAGELELAAEIVESCAMRAISNFNFVEVIHWIRQFPFSLIEEYPRLGFYFAIASFELGHIDDIVPMLQVTESAIEKNEFGDNSTEKQDRIRREVRVMNAVLDCVQTNFKQGIQKCLESFDVLTNDDAYISGFMAYYMGIAYASARDLKSATEALRNSSRNAYKHQYSFPYVFAQCELARVLKKQGRLRDAEREYQRTMEYIHQKGLGTDALIIPQSGLGDICRERGDLEAAQSHMQVVADYIGEIDFTRFSWLYSFVVCSRLIKYHMNLNDLDGAFLLCQRSQQNLQTQKLSGYLSSEVVDTQTRLWIAQGNMVAINQWVSEKLAFKQNGGKLTEAEVLSLARIFLSQEKAGRTLELISGIEEETRQSGYTECLIEILILKALAFYKLGQSEDALAALFEALNTANIEGYVQMFADEGPPMQTLLAKALDSIQSNAIQNVSVSRFGNSISNLIEKYKEPAMSSKESLKTTLTMESLAEPLSRRELDVLKLLATGITAREVANSLVISLNTSRTHIRHIYQKLEVNSRAEAIEKAILLGIL